MTAPLMIGVAQGKPNGERIGTVCTILPMAYVFLLIAEARAAAELGERREGTVQPHVAAVMSCHKKTGAIEDGARRYVRTERSASGGCLLRFTQRAVHGAEQGTNAGGGDVLVDADTVQWPLTIQTHLDIGSGLALLPAPMACSW